MFLSVMVLFPLTGLITLSNIAYKVKIPSFVQLGIEAKQSFVVAFMIVYALFVIMEIALFFSINIYVLTKKNFRQSCIDSWKLGKSRLLNTVLCMLLLSYLSPLKFNRDALHWYSKDKLKYFYISIAIALLVIAGLLGFRLYMNAKNPLYQEIPMFGLYLNIHTRWFYPLNIIFQELFIKAFTQENIAVALQDTDKKDRSDYERKHAFLTAFITAVFFCFAPAIRALLYDRCLSAVFYYRPAV
ncbi:MAG: glycerophosphoryl diester phosphodiesterase membrane domain-containing protein [Erysipelotrichaceae bacterium]|nr:glycerophosphoryl diester phosphodiesterase membrane domain-containing protein [Erysipelotrichaceae bacterium]